MRTAILPALRQDPEVQVSEQVLRTCVHCGFCNATCPTYLLTGNELEGPRGRIYLIKNILEGGITPSRQTLDHLDHCLGCLACETTCPSGVVYSRLLEEARPRLDHQVDRSLAARLLRALLVWLLPHPGRFRLSLRLAGLGRLGRPLMPAAWRHLLEMAPDQLPAPARLATPGVHPAQGQRRARVLLLTGCAQQVLGPQINDAALRLLTRLGAEVVIPEGAGCCGALTFHMGERRHSLKFMKSTIEEWHRQMERAPLDAIVLSTSGCATAVKEYDHLFRHDPVLGPKAGAVVPLVKDISEAIARLGLGKTVALPRLRVAYHDACSLQHGQKIKAPPRQLLQEAGFEVVEIPEAHLCCGSAGTYNLLEPEFAQPLLERKAGHIAQVRPQAVAAGNIGCIEQLARGVKVPVLHTVELLDWATGGPKPAALEKISP
ncbi:MAG: glycolate oxidase subunit GlcF [Candidatus Latescibacteria bacterium]|nr:glycolate oxidase subunit GlcF [Candidatus Latescibacterota bacterium]